MASLFFSVLICLGWLVPDHFPPWPAFHNEAPAFVGLLLALWVDLARHRQRLRLGIGQMALLLLVLMAVAQLYAGVLKFAGDLWLVVVYLGGMIFAWVLGRLWIEEERTIQKLGALETLAIAFAAGASLSALMALIQWLELESGWAPWIMSAAHSNRALANLAQPNQLSTLLLMGTVAVIILYEKGRIDSWLMLLLMALLGAGVVLTQSRTGLVVVVALSLFGVLTAGVWQRLRPLGVLTWSGILLSGSWLFHSQGSMKIASSKLPLGDQMAEIGQRPLLWQQFGEAVAQAPWQGYGWLQTPAAQQKGAVVHAGLEQAVYTHNQLLDLAIWLGLPVTILLTILLVILVWRRRHYIADPRVMMLVAWLMPVAIHAMLEFPLTYAYFLFPVGVMLGMLDQLTQARTTKSIYVRREVLVIALLAYGALVAGIGYEYVGAEEDFRIARFENRRIGQTPEEYTMPKLRLLTQLGAVLQAMRLRAEPGMSDEALEILRLAAGRYSWGALHFRYALALALNGHPREAEIQMHLIRGLFGPVMYGEAREDFLRLENERYPQLSDVRLP